MGTNAAEDLCIPFERRLVRVLHIPPQKSLTVLAHLLTFMLPPQYWYSVALKLSRLQAFFVRMVRRNHRDRTLPARYLDRWLSLLSRTQCAFPIPWWTADYQALAETAVHEDGVVLCSTSAPLLSIALRALGDLGYTMPSVALTCQPGAEARSRFWGMPDKLPISEPSLEVLFEAHAVLQDGGTALAIADPTQALPYSPGVFRLAQANGSRVLFVFAELEPDGHIEIQFQTPPDPFCSTDASIEANLAALDLESQRVLYGISPKRHSELIAFPSPLPEPLKRSAR